MDQVLDMVAQKNINVPDYIDVSRETNCIKGLLHR